MCGGREDLSFDADRHASVMDTDIDFRSWQVAEVGFEVDRALVLPSFHARVAPGLGRHVNCAELFHDRDEIAQELDQSRTVVFGLGHRWSLTWAWLAIALAVKRCATIVCCTFR